MQEQEYVKTTFGNVADKYDKIPFFKTSAKHVAEIIQRHTNKRPSKVLDVACGTGNVVLECASCMPESMFDAIDISEGMLNKAKANAQHRELDNVTFHLKDITQLDMEKKYDVITCSYALFFLPDAPKILRALLLLLKGRGIVVFTSFTANAFKPSDEILIPLLEQYGSSSAKEYDMHSWENLKTKKDIERLCTLSYVTNMKIETKEIGYGMSIDEWWELLNNTGYKGMLSELSKEDYEKVKSEYYQEMFKHADMDGEVVLNADTYFVTVSL
jgi:ubiquinone/menaquinone biosynthesis C-methylase UbiE